MAYSKKRQESPLTIEDMCRNLKSMRSRLSLFESNSDRTVDKLASLDYAINALKNYDQDYSIENLQVERCKVGTIDNLQLFVYADDSKEYPHFHVVGDNFDSTISIEFPTYADRKYLNERQVEKIINFLNSKIQIGSETISNWEKICLYWNDNNLRQITKFIMPDYNVLLNKGEN